MVLRGVQQPSVMRHRRTRTVGLRPIWLLLALGGLLTAASLSCSLGEALVGRSAGPVPTPSRTPRPTFTPAGSLAAQDGTPGAVLLGDLPPGVTPFAAGQAAELDADSTALILYATPTGTSTPTPSSTPVPTATATATLGPSSTPQPTPFVVVVAPQVAARRGPALSFELLGVVRAGQQFMVLARTPDKDWWQICCVANQPVWIRSDQVNPQGPFEAAPEVPVPPTPTLTVTPTPSATLTPSPTPIPPFDIARGPEFPLQRDDGTVVIWAKVFQGPTDNEKPLAGYVLKVLRNNVDVSLPVTSHAKVSGFDNTGPAQGSYDYNLKFEMPHGSEADWQIYLARPDGSRVSPISKFTTMGDSYRNIVVYVAYWLAR
jgi:hypothetical protein